MTQNRNTRNASPARAAAFRLIDLRGRREPLVLMPGTATECAAGVHVTVGSSDGEALLEVTGRRPGTPTTIDGVEVVDLAQLAPGQIIAGDGFTWVYLKPLQAFIFKREDESETARLERLEKLLGSARFHEILTSRPPEKIAARRKATEVVPLRAVPAKAGGQRPFRQANPRRPSGARLLRLSLALIVAGAGAGAVLLKDHLPRVKITTSEEAPAAQTAVSTPKHKSKPAAPAPITAAETTPQPEAPQGAPAVAQVPPAPPAPIPVAAPTPAAAAPKAPRAAAPRAPGAQWIKPGSKLTPASSPAGALTQKSKSGEPKAKLPPPPPPLDPESLRPQFQEAVLLKGFDPQGALRDLRALSKRVPPGSSLGKDVQREITQLERR